LIFAYRYLDYLKPKTLDDLWLLSKESVTGGSIDRLLKMSSVKAHQRIPVDRAFLDDLTDWREKLAKAVYKARPDWAVADLNSAVQVFLDRLIFIRIAEDRGILPPHELEDIAGAWKLSGKRRSIVNDLNALFHEVNDLLNGEIFKPHLCEKVDWDQNADLVVDIVNKLYPPESLYRFDVIGVELLGSIYERYRGKTIASCSTVSTIWMIGSRYDLRDCLHPAMLKWLA
jgi:adenine-specific DNA-methyltransferase